MSLSAEVNHSEEEAYATHEGSEANGSFISKQGEIKEDVVAEVESLPEAILGSQLRQPPEATHEGDEELHFKARGEGGG